MSEQITLKFPTGEFTHSELATFNGKTNQQVWQAYQAAIKAGTIVSAGERKGKGKPSKLWKVNDGSVVVPVVQVKPVETETVEMKNLDELAEQKGLNNPTVEPVANLGVGPEPVIEATPPVKPAKAPKVEEPTVTVEELRPVVSPAVAEPSSIDVTEYGCPICGTKMLAQHNGRGYTIWCPQANRTICKSTEQPYGFNKNLQEAYEIACEKFKHI